MVIRNWKIQRTTHKKIQVRKNLNLANQKKIIKVAKLKKGHKESEEINKSQENEKLEDKVIRNLEIQQGHQNWKTIYKSCQNISS